MLQALGINILDILEFNHKIAKMNIKTIEQGDYQTNSYVLNIDGSKNCVIIDTGLENTRLLNYLSENSLNPLALVLTHGHLDHIIGVPELRKSYPDIKVYIHTLDDKMLTDPERNMSAYTGLNFATNPADILLNDGDIINSAQIKMQIFHIPGHTKGGISVYVKDADAVFTGDCVFAGSIGRTDFPGYAEGDCRKQLINAIKEKLLALDENTKLYPGHGPATTIRCEKKHNPYLNDSFNMFSC